MLTSSSATAGVENSATRSPPSPCPALGRSPRQSRLRQHPFDRRYCQASVENGGSKPTVSPPCLTQKASSVSAASTLTPVGSNSLSDPLCIRCTKPTKRPGDQLAKHITTLGAANRHQPSLSPLCRTLHSLLPTCDGSSSSARESTLPLPQLRADDPDPPVRPKSLVSPSGRVGVEEGEEEGEGSGRSSGYLKST